VIKSNCYLKVHSGFLLIPISARWGLWLFATAACLSLFRSGASVPPQGILAASHQLNSCPNLKATFPCSPHHNFSTPGARGGCITFLPNRGTIFQASGTLTTSLPLNFHKSPALKPPLKQFENDFAPLSWLPRKRRTSKQKQLRRRYLRRRKRELKDAIIQARKERRKCRRKEKGTDDSTSPFLLVL